MKTLGNGTGKSSNGGSTVKCYHSHPVIKIANGEIFGGSCHTIRNGYEIYVGLDWDMAYHPDSFPWSTPRIEMLHYPINDGSVPRDVEIFKRLVEWLCKQLQEGKKVHIGCVGGHGRTGLLISAIAATLGEHDAIAWAREKHCKKAVETSEQVDFLVEHYGVKKAKPRYTSRGATMIQSFMGLPDKSSTQLSLVSDKKIYTPAPSKKCIWAF